MRSSRLIFGTIAAVLLAGAATPALADPDGQNRRVTIYNGHSDENLERLYYTNAGDPNWDDIDVLGRDVLGPGEGFRVDFYDGTRWCLFDVKAVFENHQHVVRINVCRASNYTFRPSQ